MPHSPWLMKTGGSNTSPVGNAAAGPEAMEAAGAAANCTSARVMGIAADEATPTPPPRGASARRARRAKCALIRGYS
eukprot:SAG31_NODE_1107_length_9877_cov_4.000102_4_plen_77_part_00